MTRETFSIVRNALAVVAVLVLIFTVGHAVANPRTVPECHAALTFPDAACSPRSGGWWCDGTPVETRMCSHLTEKDPQC